MRYFTRLSYDGSPFHGWQVQQNANSVQAELNKALSVLLRSGIETTGCGRTDTGVHAEKFYAHFDSDEIPDLTRLVHQLNCILPHEIAIQSVFPVEKDAHARFSATSRTYEYRICMHKDPFSRYTAYYYPSAPDIEVMNEMCKLLFGQKDFSSFSKSNTQTFTNNCKVTTAEWKMRDGLLVFTITADRFLRNMVRALTGTLLEAGAGKLTADEFRKILDSGSREEAGRSVPAHGLTLTDVSYPFTVF